MKSLLQHLLALAKGCPAHQKAPLCTTKPAPGKQPQPVYRYLIPLGLASTLLLGQLPKATANATAFDLSVHKDGAGSFVGPDPTFPASGTDAGAGNDASDNNGVVRTYDTLVYRVSYATDQQPNSNTAFTLTITDDHHLWGVRQPECVGNLDISRDRKTLTCSELLPNSTTGFFDFVAFVKGTAPHGSTLSVNAVFNANGSILTDSPATTRVSATPKMDLTKDRPANPRRVGSFRPGPADESGVLYVWPLAVVAPRGSEMLGDADPNTPGNQIVITDVVSGISPNARLYNWAGRSGCAPNTDDSGNDPTDLGALIQELPFGASAIASQSERAVADSGTWVCTQPGGPGSDITITITDADLSGEHRPTLDARGNTLDAAQTYLITGGIEIWIPTSDLENDGDGNNSARTVTNYYSFLDTPSISGQANVEADQGGNSSVPLSDTDTVNNDRQFTLELPVSSFSQRKFYRTPYGGGSFSNNRLLYPMTELRSGDGLVMPQQVFGGYFVMTNLGSGDLTDAILCDKFDNRTQRLAPHPTTGKYVQMYERDHRLDESEVMIEYGVGGDTASDRYYGDDAATVGDSARYTAQRNATCGDSDATWYTEAALTSSPSLIPQVNRVRIRPSANGVLATDSAIEAVVHLQALTADPVTGETLPGLSILANYVTSRANEVENGSWNTGSYQPEDHSGNNDGDRLRLTQALVRIDKKTDDPNNPNEVEDTINSVKASDNITFALEPTLTAFVENPPEANIVISDTLPAELSYVFGSANIAPTTVTQNADGTTTIVWELGPYAPNTVIPTLTFQATARFDVEGGTNVTSQVMVTALDSSGNPLDHSPEADRTDARSVTISNNATFSIFKEAVNPEIDLGEEIIYDLYFANLSDDINVAAGSQFIDILPYEGDGSLRNPMDGMGTPPTDYTATPIFKQIEDVDNVGFSFQYTNDTPANISDNPATQNGSTIWCTSVQIDAGTAGCPAADYTDVTAILMIAPAINASAPTHRLRLTLSAAGGFGNDVYTNNFKGTPNHPSLSFIPSIDATVRTRATSAPDVVLVKRITAINGQTTNPNDGTDLTTVVNDGNNNSAADLNSWPDGYLRGELDAGLVLPGDQIEYVVYFLNAGGREATDVRLCDWIQPNQRFVTGLYAGNDIALQLGEADGSATYHLTAAEDTDQAQLATVGNLPAGSPCNLPASATDPNDAVLVLDLPSLPRITEQGTPDTAFGFFRFSTQVDE